MLKRIGLFLLTNVAVLVLLGIIFAVLNLLGINFNFLGQGYGPLLLTSALWGFPGALISLALSKWMAKRSTGAKVIEHPSNATEQWLLSTVARQAKEAGINTPEVAIYPSPDVNAFATGMRKNASLVAVSAGLLSRMSQEEAEAVLAHEISHVANGDMVTLGLIQGVVNTFVIFLSRVVGMMIDQALSGRGNRGGRGVGYFISVMVLQTVFGFLATMVVMWFSRWREFRADAGAAKLESAPKMIAALERLQSNKPTDLPASMAAMGIAGGMRSLFSSHPPLEKRIARLQIDHGVGNHRRFDA